MKPDFKFKFGRRKKLASLLGLTLDGSHLDGVVLKRTNGSLQLAQHFSVALTLDPLTAAPELVGREIRNLLDAAGVRERNCVFGVPLKWVLTAHTELPPLPEADAASLLQLEAERGFHSDLSTLQIANSRSPLAGDKQNVLLAGIPGTHIAALEKILAAAKLKPVSFALGLSALQPAENEKSQGVLALLIGANQVGLQVEIVAGYAPDEFGATLPPEVSLSAAFSLAAAYLMEQRPAFEFLPPKPGLIEQFVTKYSSGRLRTTGAVAAGIALIVIGLFLFQQIELWHLNSQWSHMEVKVAQLEAVEGKIQQYRPWYGRTFNNLSILRQLSLSFPENGSVTAKSIEIHDGNTVTCSGTAENYASLLAMQSSLQKADGVSEVSLEQIRGKAPMQFVFGFKFNNGGGSEN